MKPQHFIVFLSLSGIAVNATADLCRYISTGGKQDIVNINTNPTISVPRDTPNGTILYESTPYQHGTINDYYCSATHPWGIKNNLGTDTPTTNIFPIHNTGISWQYIFTGVARLGYGGFTESSGNKVFANTTTALRLIKTGDIGDGVTIPAGDIGYIKTDTLLPTAIRLSQEIKITASSCETPDIKVDMGSTIYTYFQKRFIFKVGKLQHQT